MPKRWLHRDAANRAWRTAIQGVLVTMAAAAADAAVQVYQRAAAEAAQGRALDWTQVGTTARYTALTAAAMALAAYLHRRVVDPSTLPSALPPAPPGATATTVHDHRPDTR